MLLRRNRRIVDGQTYEYGTLVQTIRTAKGPRQKVVATLGKTPGLESPARHGWEEVADLLEGRVPGQVQGPLGQPLEEPLPPSGRRSIGAACAWSGCATVVECIWRWRSGGGWAGTRYWLK